MLPFLSFLIGKKGFTFFDMPPKIYPQYYRDPREGNHGFTSYSAQPNAEKKVFEALKEKLGANFYVFHSFRWNSKVRYGKEKKGENDFMIYHPDLGILIVEVKGGKISYHDNSWYRYETKEAREVPLKGAKDPLNQALDAQSAMLHIFRNVLEQSRVGIPIHYALWFPDYQFGEVGANFPVKTYELFDELTLNDPEEAIRFLFEQKGGKVYEKHEEILNVLFPSLNIVKKYKAEKNQTEQQFMMLTHSQANILNFTEDQAYTAIRGGAGTGKTLIAEEKARRLTKEYPQDLILFICFNKALQHHLFHQLKDEEQIHVFTYDQFIRQAFTPEQLNEFSKKALTEDKNYFDLIRSEFYAFMLEHIEWFKYQHIIIDEAQDFDNDWIELLESTNPKHLYLFYDSRQDLYEKVRKIPAWMLNIDCRLSLKTNCRNTEEIANFSERHLSLLEKEKNPTLTSIQGIKSDFLPQIIILNEVEDIREFITEKVNYWHQQGIDIRDKSKVVSLRSSSDEGTYLKAIPQLQNVQKPTVLKVKTNAKFHSIPYSTARKIKGLEADFVFLVDVELDRLTDETYRRRFYVGASRAKHELYVLLLKNNFKEIEFKTVLEQFRISIQQIENASFNHLLELYADVVGAQVQYYQNTEITN